MMFQNWNVLLHRLGEIPGVEPVTHPQADAALVEDARLKARLESHCVKHLLGAEGMTDAGDTRVIHLRKRFQVVHAARSVESRFTQTGPARSPLSKFLRRVETGPRLVFFTRLTVKRRYSEADKLDVEATAPKDGPQRRLASPAPHVGGDPVNLWCRNGAV